MEPFANQKPSSRDNRRLVIIVLAAASFGIWYFDLVPQLSPVATGTLETDITDPNLSQDDFLAMMGDSPVTAELPEGFDPDAFPGNQPDLDIPKPDDDPLLSRMQQESNDIQMPSRNSADCLNQWSMLVANKTLFNRWNFRMHSLLTFALMRSQKSFLLTLPTV